jgi:hypothetical protein
MKFNFKKVVSVLATTAMLGSTVAFAAAAYPAPFVSSGAADAAIIVGSTAASSDMVAATDLRDSLNTGVTATTAGTITGEAKAVETASQALYVGDYLNNTKSTFTKTELPTILADQTVTDTDGNAITVTQKVLSPLTQVKYGKTSDNLAIPILYLDFPSSTATYESDIVFSPAVNLTKLVDKDITLFGKKFSFSGSATDLTTTNAVLYESSQRVTINSGESTTVEVGGVSYTIAVTGVEDSTHATITVNGVSQNVVEATSYKVAGLDVYVKSVMGASVAGETRSVELSAGSAKLTLTNAASVTKGSTTVDGTSVAFTSSGGKVSKIAITITPSSQTPSVNYLKMGESVNEPVFGGYKISFNSVTPALEDASKDSIVIKSSGEQKASMTWTNEMGETYSMDMFMPSDWGLNTSKLSNTTKSQYNTYNASKLGYDTYKIARYNLTKNDYFMTTSGAYSQIWRVQAITLSTNNEVTVRDMGSGGAEQKVTLSGAATGSTATITLGDGNTATLTLSANGTTDSSKAIDVTTGYSTTLRTKSGASIDLQYLDLNSSTYNQNLSKVVITEEESGGYNDGTWTKNTGATIGNSVNVSLLYTNAGLTGNDLRIDTVTVGDSYSGSVGDYDTYYLTTYGSFVKKTGNNDQVFTMYYPGTAAMLGVYVAEQAAITGTDSAKVQVFKDTEANSVKSKNLIVVGGSCVNTVARMIVDAAATAPICGADFSAKTNVGAGQYLIQVAASPLNAGKIAMLVAGYEAADTTAAVAKVKEGTVDTSKTGSTVYPLATA